MNANAKRAALTRRYRKVSWGRLYWRPSPSKRPDRRFSDREVCIVQDGPYKDRFYSLDAFIERIEYAERVEQAKQANDMAWSGKDDFNIDGRVY